MSRISRSTRVSAAGRVRAMGLTQKEQLADELARVQPHLFASFLVQRRLGVSLAKMDFLLDILLIRYAPDRKGERPREHLKAFSGILQADAYAGFGHLYGERIREAACWAHARRAFYDLHQATNSPIAAEALE